MEWVHITHNRDNMCPNIQILIQVKLTFNRDGRVRTFLFLSFIVPFYSFFFQTFNKDWFRSFIKLSFIFNLFCSFSFTDRLFSKNTWFLIALGKFVHSVKNDLVVYIVPKILNCSLFFWTTSSFTKNFVCSQKTLPISNI